MNNYPIQQQQQLQQNHHHLPPPQPHRPPSSTVIEDDAIAAADKEMEERANRAKELLSQRYDAIRQHQVSLLLYIQYCTRNIFNILTHSFCFDNLIKYTGSKT